MVQRALPVQVRLLHGLVEDGLGPLTRVVEHVPLAVREELLQANEVVSAGEHDKTVLAAPIGGLPATFLSRPFRQLDHGLVVALLREQEQRVNLSRRQLFWVGRRQLQRQPILLYVPLLGERSECRVRIRSFYSGVGYRSAVTLLTVGHSGRHFYVLLGTQGLGIGGNLTYSRSFRQAFLRPSGDFGLTLPLKGAPTIPLFEDSHGDEY